MASAPRTSAGEGPAVQRACGINPREIRLNARCYDRSTWSGVSAPAGVPKDIIAQLNSAIVKAVNSAEIKEAFIKQGLEPQTNTPEQFSALIHREIEQNANLIKAIGISKN